MMVCFYDVKGQGLSMSTIVIAALALIVLVILATFLLSGSGGLHDAMDCEANNGTCETLGQNDVYNCSDDEVAARSYNCDNANKGCCLPLGN